MGNGDERMSFSISATSSTVAVVGTVSVGIPTGATWVQKSTPNGSTVANGTVVHTVTAGKTFYAVSIGVYTANAAATTTWMKFDTDTVMAHTGLNTTPANISSAYPYVATCAATKNITINTGAAGTPCGYILLGYEV
jgi:hypothetical protein